MKNFYMQIAVSCIFAGSMLPKTMVGQCSCAAGITPNSLTYAQTLPMTNAVSSTISFPRFDPSLGTLTCIKFEDTISGATNSIIQNSGSTKTLFQFLLTVANTIAAPGVSITQTFKRDYGPDSLAPGGQITFGPDSLFKNTPDSTYATDTTGWQGNGNISLTYTLSGGLVAIAGGLNYNAQIITNYWGNFRLTYYYCSSSAQSSQKHCSGLTATKGSGNGSVDLKWTCDPSSTGSNSSFEVSCSKSGNQFAPIGNCQSPSQVSQNTATYSYTYNCQPEDKNKIYFQVKYTDSAGDVNYCPTRWVDLSKQGIGGCNMYPNPARSSCIAEFDEMLTGDYRLELINGTGSCVQRKAVSLQASNQMNVDVSGLRKGLYFLHLTDNSTHQQIVCKVVVQ